jgi:hypothetical protein
VPTVDPLPPMSELQRAVADIDSHLEHAGWDQPMRLYALVETADLLAREPHLAETLGLGVEAPPGALMPVEQEDLPDLPLDELLATITWPPEVLGAAVSQEVISLPPEAETEAVEDAEDPISWAGAHPEREDIRLTVGVLRDGQRGCAIRRRGGAEILLGEDLAPHLAAALVATFED